MALVVNVFGNTEQFEAAMKRAQSVLRRFAAQARRVISVMAKFAAAIIAAGAAITTHLVRGSLAAVDANAKLARQLGTTSESMGVLNRALELSGKDFSEVREAITNMNKRLGEAERGTGTAVEALKTLNLEAGQLTRLPLDQRLALIGRRMQEVELSASQQAVVMAQLGSEQGRLFNLFEDGAAVLDRAAREASAFGLAISDVDASRIEAANDAMSSISAVFRGIGNRIAVRLAPLLEDLGNRFTALAVKTEGFRSQISATIRFIVAAIGRVADAFRLVQVNVAAIKLVASEVRFAWTASLTAVEKFARQVFSVIATGVNRSIDLLNALPGIEIPKIEPPATPEADQSGRAALLKDTLAMQDAQIELLQLLAEPLPSESLQQWLDEVSAASEATSAKLVSDRASAAATVAEIEDEAARKARELAEKRARERAEAEKKRMEEKLEAFRFGLLTEEEQEVESFARRLEALAAFHEAEMISEAERDALMERLKEQHEARLTAIKKAAEDQRTRDAKRARQQEVRAATSAAGSLLGIASALFGENKKIAIAESILFGLKGVARTLGEYPYPINLAMGALHAAAAAAQTAAIASTSGPGGAGGGAGGGGGAAQAAAAAPAAAPQQSLVIQGLDPGSIFSGEAVRDLAERLVDFQRDGGRVILA